MAEKKRKSTRTNRSQTPVQPKADWRKQAEETLEEIAECCRNPEEAAMYREIRRDLPKLSREEADRRCREVVREHQR